MLLAVEKLSCDSKYLVHTKLSKEEECILMESYLKAFKPKCLIETSGQLLPLPIYGIGFLILGFNKNKYDLTVLRLGACKSLLSFQVSAFKTGEIRSK